jgi:hypothetical protein
MPFQALLKKRIDWHGWTWQVSVGVLSSNRLKHWLSWLRYFTTFLSPTRAEPQLGHGHLIVCHVAIRTTQNTICPHKYTWMPSRQIMLVYAMSLSSVTRISLNSENTPIGSVLQPHRQNLWAVITILIQLGHMASIYVLHYTQNVNSNMLTSAKNILNILNWVYYYSY